MGLRPSILVAVPTYEGIAVETAESLMAMIVEAARVARVTPAIVAGYDVKKNRNRIASAARLSDFVLMVDSDVVVPKNLLDYLLEPQADIVLAPYPRKNTSRGRSELFRLGTPNYTDENNIPIDELRSTGGRIPVKGGGLGCALIRSAVFSRLEYPWFDFTQDSGGNWLSEDFYFCGKAREAGIDIQADCRVVCGHVGKVVQYG